MTLARNGQSLDPALWNRGVPVNGGEYVIGGGAPGHEDWKTTVTVPVESGKVSVEVPKLKEIVKLVQPTPMPTRRKIGMGMAGASAGGLVVGIVLGALAKSKQDEAHRHCSSTQTPCPDAALANRLIDEARGRAIGANIAFGVAGALAIGAGVLWFTGASEVPAHHVAVAPSVAPGEAGVVVFGRFELPPSVLKERGHGKRNASATSAIERATIRQR